MSGFTWTPEAHRYADFRIRFWTQEIMECVGISKSEVEEKEDISFRLWADLLRRMRRYNPGRAGHHTFISEIVLHEALEILKSFKSGKDRRRRRSISLNERITNDEGTEVERQDLLGEDQYRAALTGNLTTGEELLDERIEIARRLARLSARDRALCERLASESLSEIAQSRGVTRHVVYEEIREIRRIFGPRP